MSSNEQYPVRMEKFGEVPVPFLEVNGQDCLTGEDLGRCLGFADPVQAVGRIFRRHREELEKYTVPVNLTVNPLGRPVERVFSETACNLIGMFARTRIAKDFRLWLARLPRRVREMVPEASRRLLAEGVKKGFTIASDLMTGKVDRDDLVRIWWWRRHHATQKEVAALLDLSREQVQVMERHLVELGMEFPAVNANKRLRQIKDAFADEIARLGGQQIPPSPPLLKGGEEAGHGTAAG